MVPLATGITLCQFLALLPTMEVKAHWIADFLFVGQIHLSPIQDPLLAFPFAGLSPTFPIILGQIKYSRDVFQIKSRRLF